MRTRTRKTARLGDLVAAVFDEAARYSANRREISRLATEAAMHLVLRGRVRPVVLVPAFP